MSSGRFDALFATLAQQHDGVEALLDSFFDFMHRKTDFYVVTRNPAQRKMGFLPGHAQQKVLQAFLKYPFKDLDGSLTNTPPAGNVTSKSAPAAAQTQTLSPPLTQQSQTTAVQQRSLRASEQPKPNIERTESGKQVPVGNGGSTDTYTWTQSLDETTIYLDVPPGTRSKDLECTITATHVRVRLKSAAPDAATLLEGAFPDKIRADESLWSLERDATQLQLSLEKVKKTWWASALQGDDEVDTSQVDSKRDIHEYDSETQGAIRKAMFDQQQKQSGLPTSDDLLLESMVAQARQAPNTPI